MSLKTISRNIFLLGIVLAVFLVTFELLVRHKTVLKPLARGISQVKLQPLEPSSERINILEEDGKLRFNGWDKNVGDKYFINYRDAQNEYFSQKYSYMKYRAWNFVMVYMPHHIIQMPITNFWPACVTSVQIYPREDPTNLIKNRRIWESNPLNCANLDLNSVEWLNNTMIEEGDSKIQFQRQDNGKLRLTIRAPKIGFEADLKLDDKVVDDQFFLMPLTDDKQSYFANSKKFGIKAEGQYTYGGQTHQCKTEDHCLALYDNGRAQFTYHTNWFWASFTYHNSQLNKDISINFGDGIGTDYNPSDNQKFYEDFINIEGEMIKLDQTDIEYSEQDMMQTHKFKTTTINKAFKNRSCDLMFEPTGVAKDGIHIIVLGITQYLVYGFWSGFCEIDGLKIHFDKVLGTVEHVRARW
ncbi:UNKNOWN [Stylonychia lemnae]|uniref:Uncharacterized protein n=1 Tax=Stylonychia lemnae TaxID=5949 RepID=A0A077ZRV7_STYLE|nr:UNKNOWN [Stylonychia lemnae]|eukprot:CDW71221.1 UNKNOWN [Stylonychia lemnae]